VTCPGPSGSRLPHPRIKPAGGSVGFTSATIRRGRISLLFIEEVAHIVDWCPLNSPGRLRRRIGSSRVQRRA
jgi:hypothetical protein